MDNALEVVQVDHTPVDVIVVDEVHRLPIGRPWLTLAIDVATRVVVGFYVSLEAPSSTSVALCLALRLLHRKPPKLMIVDEVDHLLAGSVREQRQSLNQLKFPSNELRMPVIAALGTSEALCAMQADPQIASRFEPFAPPRWHQSAALQEVVVSFGRLLPLHKPSPFGDKAIIQKLMVHSGGLTGQITTLLARKPTATVRDFRMQSFSRDLVLVGGCRRRTTAVPVHNFLDGVGEGQVPE